MRTTAPPGSAPSPVPAAVRDGLDSAVSAHARLTMAASGKTFALARRALPADLRDDVNRLYLVLRTLDDLVDEGRPEAVDRVAAVAAWAGGEPVTPTREVRLLTELDGRHGLPRTAVADFCDGMRQDLRRETFRTEADLDAYCYRVAGTVGILMAAIIGTDDARAAAPSAAALGMAMQRTNLLRDIDADERDGRTFLPLDAIERHGPARPGRRAALLREQIARADELYERGLAGVGRLRRGRAAVAAAGAMYREILRELERDGLGARPGRVVVGRRRKLLVGLRAAAPHVVPRRDRANGLLAALMAVQVLYGLDGRERSSLSTRAVLVLGLVASAAEARRARGAAGVVATTLAGAVGFGAELVGVGSDRPFGRYAYSRRLGPQIGHVPVLAAAAWAMMSRPAWVAAGWVDERPVVRIPLAAAGLTAWDVFLDPRMVREGYWRWAAGGRYADVPLSNFAGWFLTGLAIFGGVAVLDRSPAQLRDDGALTLYGWTWIGEAFANAVLWRRPAPAVAGTVAMGLLAVPALRRRWG